MSEIRRVKVKITDLESMEKACVECGLALVKEGKKLIVKNHNINCWRNLPIEVKQLKDGSYELSGDCSKAELDKLALKIQAQYNINVVVKASKKLGYNFVEKNRANNKTKIKLRIW